MDKRLLYVYNPHSGKGAICNKLGYILDILAKGGYELIVHPTQCVGDARRTIGEYAAQVDQIVCSGGDGTLDEVISGVMESGLNIPVGYIPSGSTNDFAETLGLPKDMLEGARRIVEGTPFQCDVGALNDKTFVYIAAFGMFTEVSYETSQNLKNSIGYMAYLVEAGKRIFDIPSYHVKVTCGDRVVEDNFAYGMISNANSVGGLKNFPTKNASLDDGLFEITLVRAPKNPLQLSEAITAMLFGTDSAMLWKGLADNILLEPDEELHWTVDGEDGGIWKNVEVRNLKRSITLIR